MSLRKGAVALALTLLMSLLSGCWGSRDLKTLALVMGIAIDSGEDSGEYEVTLQVANPNAFQIGGGGDMDAYSNYTDSGAGIESALDKIKNQVERKLYTGHNQLIIISRAVAENGIEPILDFLIRSADARFTIALYISDGAAKDMLEIASELEPLPARYIKNLTDAQMSFDENSPAALIEFFNKFRGGTDAPTLPVIAALGEGEERYVTLAGLALFQGAVLSTVLPPEQLDNLALINCRGAGRHVRLDTDDGYIMLTVKDAQVKLSPHLAGEVWEMEVAVKMDCILSETTVELDILSTEIRDNLAALAEDTVAESLQDILTDTQSYGADVFGFGSLLRRHHRHRAAAQLENWPESYQALSVRFTISVDIASTGTSIRTIGH